MEATAEQTLTPTQEAPAIPDVMRERYSGYRIHPLFKVGKTSYFRVNKWGVNADGDTCLIRSAFVQVKGGKITER